MYLCCILFLFTWSTALQINGILWHFSIIISENIVSYDCQLLMIWLDLHENSCFALYYWKLRGAGELYWWVWKDWFAICWALEGIYAPFEANATNSQHWSNNGLNIYILKKARYWQLTGNCIIKRLYMSHKTRTVSAVHPRAITDRRRLWNQTLYKGTNQLWRYWGENTHLMEFQLHGILWDFPLPNPLFFICI